jgi:hypothetical protein
MNNPFSARSLQRKSKTVRLIVEGLEKRYLMAAHIGDEFTASSPLEDVGLANPVLIVDQATEFPNDGLYDETIGTELDVVDSGKPTADVDDTVLLDEIIVDGSDTQVPDLEYSNNEDPEGTDWGYENDEPGLTGDGVIVCDSTHVSMTEGDLSFTLCDFRAETSTPGLGLTDSTPPTDSTSATDLTSPNDSTPPTEVVDPTSRNTESYVTEPPKELEPNLDNSVIAPINVASADSVAMARLATGVDSQVQSLSGLRPLVSSEIPSLNPVSSLSEAAGSARLLKDSPVLETHFAFALMTADTARAPHTESARTLPTHEIRQSASRSGRSSQATLARSRKSPTSMLEYPEMGGDPAAEMQQSSERTSSPGVTMHLVGPATAPDELAATADDPAATQFQFELDFAGICEIESLIFLATSCLLAREATETKIVRIVCDRERSRPPC